MSRRARIHEQTRQEIKTVAHRLMAEQGTSALSLGAVARALDITPQAIYHYYANRDELITTLLVDAYHNLAAALAEASQRHPDADYATRLLVTSLAYRAWAVDHPIDFLLMFGNPIPLYSAPVEQTAPAAQRVFVEFLTLLQAAHDAHLLRIDAPPSAIAAWVAPPPHFDTAASQVDPAVAYIAVVSWATIHGLVMLELTNHMQPTLTNLGSIYQHECLRLLASIGLTPSAIS
ncbi:MAG: TetR/AcrR family transcriptional regulator [Chloroflexales bacterium]|nr:TetR/AcrR family transcriptional regulator [Chloroflexales bacterium]